MFVRIPPKYSVSEGMGYFKDKKLLNDKIDTPIQSINMGIDIFGIEAIM